MSMQDIPADVLDAWSYYVSSLRDRDAFDRHCFGLGYSKSDVSSIGRLLEN